MFLKFEIEQIYLFKRETVFDFFFLSKHYSTVLDSLLAKPIFDLSHSGNLNT